MHEVDLKRDVYFFFPRSTVRQIQFTFIKELIEMKRTYFFLSMTDLDEFVREILS